MNAGPTRLQVGTSLLEMLPDTSLRTFLSPAWLHLGEPDRQPPPASTHLLDYWRRHGTVGSGKAVISRVRARARGVAPKAVKAAAIRDLPGIRFEPFWFSKNSQLPCEDDSMAFVYSEHFLEHLFLDEAMALLRDVRRVLRPGGVVRVVVPDADLRTYAKPEPVGYPGPALDWSHPDKHKTRWSVYALQEAMTLAGFDTVALEFCDRERRFISQDPREKASLYPDSVDAEVVFDLSYVARRPSLIVDGIRTE